MATLKSKYMAVVVSMDETTIRNKKHGDDLGIVRFLPAWRQFVFVPEFDTEYNNSCLREIADYLEQLNAERKA